MAKLDTKILTHLEWLGFIQPTGLVVSATALSRAGAILGQRDIEGQQLLLECVQNRVFDSKEGEVPFIPDFFAFARIVLGWSWNEKGYAGISVSPIPDELEVVLEDYGETLRPNFAVKELEAVEGMLPWQLLITIVDPGQGLDDVRRGSGILEASAHSRMERLLRQTQVHAGILFNGLTFRVISAPRGESSGWMDFHVSDMIQTAGRPLCSALRLLLSETRLLSLPKASRLPALLEDSRKYQNEVSERLAEQVLHSLYELLRGFQSAHDASKGELLRYPLNENPDEIYRALLIVILRMVFLLFSEERNMLPGSDTYIQHYSLSGLYLRLREDAALFPDTMEQRYGAWAQLIVLFRMVFDGSEAEDMHLPRRHGVLFDPDRFPFLEGRGVQTRQVDERIEFPLVPDGTLFRVLENLLVLDGERISYRALDVEQIGSVYETMMGFRLETASGLSLAIKAAKKHGAPTTINIEELLDIAPDKRNKWFQDHSDRKLTDRVNKMVKTATSLEELHVALDSVIDLRATPDLVPPGAMVLQPSEERRRSGSHYTPRELTEPIVRTTLEPILKNLHSIAGGIPKPETILDLKICDPAMGSGAFLVETCRQLGDALIESWKVHQSQPVIPADEDEVILARRLIAQRCLYGVDRNLVAVDLAKVSLWLITLAKEHALTFVDHALRHGDSLVGLTTKQVQAFHWEAGHQEFDTKLSKKIGRRVTKYSDLRHQIRSAGEDVSDKDLAALWKAARDELSNVRLYGDLVLASFFLGKNKKDRDEKRTEFINSIKSGSEDQYRSWLLEMRSADPPLASFHWELEFPEVFLRSNPGFDAFVGNPPFAGKNTLAAANVSFYPVWLKTVHSESHGNSDIVAHFFRRSFSLIRENGSFGMIATKTIRQGDTRFTGLRWICLNGGTIFTARRRLVWPGQASVIVSVIHGIKGHKEGPFILDGKHVDSITAFLFHSGSSENPIRLEANDNKCFVGNVILGVGFTFDDFDKTGKAGTLEEMRGFLDTQPKNRERIFPYINGQEVNTKPDPVPSRYIINFGKLSKEEAKKWPDLYTRVKERVMLDRQSQGSIVNPNKWWQFARSAAELYIAITGLDRVIARSLTSTNFKTFTFLPADYIYDQTLIIFPFEEYAALGLLASRIHEAWSLFVGGSMKDDPRYNVEDCFRTFPFPLNWKTSSQLNSISRKMYLHRQSIMTEKNQGLTKLYNRFNDPSEIDPAILKLRDLHESMDRAVLDAYGWKDIQTDCQFLLDYELDEAEMNSRRKKPWRYRWPEDVHDEVLARLLELNAQRAQEEAQAKQSEKENSIGEQREIFHS